MYLTIDERKIRNQEAAVRNLANKYLDIEVGISKVIKQIESEWEGAGADSQIQKLRNTLRETNTTRMELLNVASLLDQYCVSHRTVWELFRVMLRYLPAIRFLGCKKNRSSALLPPKARMK